MIEPCPFCESEDVKLRLQGDPTRPYYVECEICKARGPRRYWPKDALNIWNYASLVMFRNLGR